MTKGGFEVSEDWSHDQSTNADTRLALLDDSLFSARNVQRVADTPQDKAQSAKDTTALLGEAAAVKEPTTPSEKEFAAAAEAFAKSPDKLKAMAELGPKFEGAIKLADQEFDATMKAATAEGQNLQPKYMKAMQDAQVAQMQMMAAFSGVPADKQEAVQKEIELYSMLDDKDPLKASIGAALGKYPGLKEGADAMDKAMNDPAVKRVEELKEQVEGGLANKVMMRMGYSEALESVGAKDKAWQMLREAAHIMGKELPEKRPLPPGTLEASLKFA